MGRGRGLRGAIGWSGAGGLAVGRDTTGRARGALERAGKRSEPARDEEASAVGMTKVQRGPLLYVS